MSDLNLNFDTGLKSVGMSNTVNDNLGFQKSPDNQGSPTKRIITTEPSLVTSDPIGVGLLSNTPNIQISPTSSPKSDNSQKSEEFSFFKPSEDKGGIIDGDLPNNDKNVNINI